MVIKETCIIHIIKYFISKSYIFPISTLSVVIKSNKDVKNSRKVKILNNFHTVFNVNNH